MKTEEIMKEANIRYDVNHPFIDIAKESFIAGANWADKTMLDRACEWLKTLTYQEFAGAPLERLITDELITAFRQAMKGGAE